MVHHRTGALYMLGQHTGSIRLAICHCNDFENAFFQTGLEMDGSYAPDIAFEYNASGSVADCCHTGGRTADMPVALMERGEEMRGIEIASTVSVTCIHIRQWKSTPRAIIAFSAILCIGYLTAMPYKAMLIANDSYIALSEIGGLLVSSSALYGVVIYLYLISNVPFDADMQEFITARIGRLRFLLAEEFYILLSAALFMFLPRLGGVIAILPRVFLSANWSESGLAILGLQQAPEPLPAVVSLLAYIKGVLYCAILGNLVMFGNTCLKSKYGFMISTYLHGFSWAMTLDGIWGRLALFSYSLLSLNTQMDYITICVDLAMIIVLFALIYFLMRKRVIIGGIT